MNQTDFAEIVQKLLGKEPKSIQYISKGDSNLEFHREKHLTVCFHRRIFSCMSSRRQT